MKMPGWWTEMGWDFRLIVVFLVIYTPFMCWAAVRP